MSQVVVIHYGFDFTLFDKFYRIFFFHNKETSANIFLIPALV